jgi:hypothetical protein
MSDGALCRRSDTQDFCSVVSSTFMVIGSESNISSASMEALLSMDAPRAFSADTRLPDGLLFCSFGLVGYSVCDAVDSSEDSALSASQCDSSTTLLASWKSSSHSLPIVFSQCVSKSAGSSKS